MRETEVRSTVTWCIRAAFRHGIKRARAQQHSPQHSAKAQGGQSRQQQLLLCTSCGECNKIMPVKQNSTSLRGLSNRDIGLVWYAGAARALLAACHLRRGVAQACALRRASVSCWQRGVFVGAEGGPAGAFLGRKWPLPFSLPQALWVRPLFFGTKTVLLSFVCSVAEKNAAAGCRSSAI